MGGAGWQQPYAIIPTDRTEKDEHMAIDDCRRSFEELAQMVLPKYMARLRTAMKEPKPLSEFAAKGVGPDHLEELRGFARNASHKR